MAIVDRGGLVEGGGLVQVVRTDQERDGIASTSESDPQKGCQLPLG